jgi:uncharacterized protein YjbI with pentapeptide repeats
MRDAIILGAGPSLAPFFPELENLPDNYTVFALNHMATVVPRSQYLVGMDLEAYLSQPVLTNLLEKFSGRFLLHYKFFEIMPKEAEVQYFVSRHCSNPEDVPSNVLRLPTNGCSAGAALCYAMFFHHSIHILGCEGKLGENGQHHCHPWGRPISSQHARSLRLALDQTAKEVKHCSNVVFWDNPKDFLTLIKERKNDKKDFTKVRKAEAEDFSKQNLSGALFTATERIDTDFYKAQLSHAKFTRANVSFSNFEEANLTEACFYRAKLNKCNLKSADLTKADLSFAKLPRAKLAHANLTGAKLTSADLTAANLYCANLTGALLVGVKLFGADLSGCIGLPTQTQWLKENCIVGSEGIYALKMFDLFFVSPAHWTLQKGAELTEVCNPDRATDCGSGINVASLTWLNDTVRENFARYRGLQSVWLVKIPWQRVADIVVPFNTDGKFRTSYCELVEEWNVIDVQDNWNKWKAAVELPQED